MKNKSIIVISIMLISAIAGIGFWVAKNQEGSNEIILKEKAENDVATEESQHLNQEKKQEFVVDVDMNVDHWQTKETEFFTIKFPKEWYWLESDPEKTGYHSRMITNNPNFDIDKYADIGVGTGGNYPLEFENKNEVVISFSGAATSDAGTPQQSIESGLRGIRENHLQAICEYSSDLTDLPIIIANCIFADSNYQKVQTYFVVNEKNKIFFSIRTTEDNLAKKEIFYEIAKNMILSKAF
ncbi:MAG: hypothetical protein V3574_04940 [Candidatus Moraniibacteriota bacterium]